MRPHPRGGHTPHARRWVADARVVGADDLIGVERDVGAAGDREPVQFRDGGFVGVEQAREAAVEAAHHLVVDHRIPGAVRVVVAGLHHRVEHGAGGVRAIAWRLGVLGEDRQVVPTAESLTPPRHHDDVHTGVEVGTFHRGGQIDGCVGGDRVSAFGAVEGDAGDTAGHLVGERRIAGWAVGRRTFRELCSLGEWFTPGGGAVVGRTHANAPTAGIARSTMVVTSTPDGRVPNTSPRSPASRVAEKAPATASLPRRTNREP